MPSTKSIKSPVMSSHFALQTLVVAFGIACALAATSHCQAGYASFNGTGCMKCRPGTWTNTSGATICEECPLGRASSQTGTTSCQECQAGSFSSVLGANICTGCFAGTSASINGSTNCSKCPAGKASSIEGQTLCYFCESGRWTSMNGTINCTNCVMGTFGIDSGATAKELCVACSAGRFSNIEGYSIWNDQSLSEGCFECDFGRYTSSTGSTDCISCPAGSFGSKEGLSACIQCRPGSWSSSVSQTSGMSCAECSTGRYIAKWGSTSEAACKNCTIGKYNPRTGSGREEECIACDSGFHTLWPGATSPQACCCRAGLYNKINERNESLCLLCTGQGIVCRGEFSNISSMTHRPPYAAKGWYMVSMSKAMRCTITLPDGSSTCKGGASFMNQSDACVRHFTGPLCAACKFHATRKDFAKPCRPCSIFVASWILILQLQTDCILKALSGLFMAYRAELSAESLAKLDSVLLRIFIHFTTVSSVLQTLDMSQVKLLGTTAGTQTSASQFPTWFGRVAGIVFFFGEGLQVLGSNQEALECLAIRWMNNAAAKRTVPIIFWLLYPINVALWVLICATMLAKARSIILHVRTRVPGLPGFGIPTISIGPAVLIAFYNTWQAFTKQYLYVLNAIRLPRETGGFTSLWAGDAQLDFFGDAHKPVGLLGLLGLVVWSFSGPFCIFMMCYVRRAKLQDIRTKRWLGYFYLGLEPQYYWWELLVKRLDLLAVFTVAYSSLMPSPTAKVIMYMWIAGAFWIIQCKASPYDNRYVFLADRAEEAALRARFITLSGLSLIIVLDTGKNINLTVAVLLVVLNTISVSWIVLCTVTLILGSTNLLSTGNGLQNNGQASHLARLASWASPIFLAFERERKSQQLRSPAFAWYGFGREIAVLRLDAAQKSWKSDTPHALLLRRLVLNLYCTNAKQHAHGVHTICQMLECVTVNACMQRWPSCILDMLMLLTIAIKRIYQDPRARMSVPEPERVCEEMRRIALDRVYEKRLVPPDEPDAQAVPEEQVPHASTLECDHVSTEDLSSALIYLQSLSKDAIILLMACVSPNDPDMTKIEDASLSYGESSGGTQPKSEIRACKEMEGHPQYSNNISMSLNRSDLPLRGTTQHRDSLCKALEACNQDSAISTSPESVTSFARKAQQEKQAQNKLAAVFLDAAVQCNSDESRRQPVSTSLEEMSLVRHALELESYNKKLEHCIQQLKPRIQ